MKSFFTEIRYLQKNESLLIYVIHKFRWDWLFFDTIFAYNFLTKRFEKVLSLDLGDDFYGKEIDLNDFKKAYESRCLKKY